MINYYKAAQYIAKYDNTQFKPRLLFIICLIWRCPLCTAI